jgi:ubiquitin C-terminal hydrolase
MPSKPDDPCEHYKKLLAQEQQLDDKYVIIDSKWFEHWKRFVGIEKSDEEKVTDPGPIDFTSLAHPDTNERSNPVQLRSNAVEGNDYTFIPHELYIELVAKHSKIGPEIIRKVIRSGEWNTVIEAFLVPLRLRLSKYSKAKTTQVYLSRRTTIAELKKEICDEYHLTPNINYRLYTSTDEDGTEWETIEEGPGRVLEDIDLTKNAFITYESTAVSTRSSGSGVSSMRTSYIPGLCGLSNLGNTCFMNSALQCLSNVPLLTEYFLTDAYREHINRENPLGKKGDVAHAYGELIHEMWSGRIGSCAPKSLKHQVSRYAPQFAGYAQQDSQEFMAFLLDGLHEDLNKVIKKLYMDKKDEDKKATDHTLAAEEWDYYRKRNQSKIHDIFNGQIKSTVKCLECKTIGRTFDPICFVSLPLPGKKKIRTFKIDYVRLNGEIKSYWIKSNEHNRMPNLIQEFCDRFQPKDKNKKKAAPMETESASASAENNNEENENEQEEDEEDEEEEENEDFTKAPDYDGHQPKPELILAAEVYNHRIHLQYSDNSSLTSILDRDQIVFYETPNSLKKGNSDNILMPCVFRDENTRQNFGYPIYLSIPRHNCRGKDIQDALQETIGKFLPLSPTNPSDKPLYVGYCQTNQNYYQQTKSLETMLGDRIEFGRTNASLAVDVASSVVDKYKKKQEDEEQKRMEKDRISSISSIDNSIQAYNQPKQSTTLTDCFKYFTKREILSNEDLWFCPTCKKLKRASKKIDLWLLPKVLIVQLKRFNYTRYFRDKIDLFVDCPLRDLDLSEFVLNADEKSKAKYDLIAVSNHMGGLGGGHYTAHARNVHDQKWHSFDDSYVSDIHENNVISKAAYVLIYQQKEQSNGQQLSENGSTKK